MKIAVDGYEMTESITGVGRVIGNLMPQLSLRFPEVSFEILTDKAVPDFPQKNIHSTSLPSGKGFFLWQNGPFYRKLKSLEPDVLIATNYTAPLRSKWKTILYEHDVSFAAHPEWFGRFDAMKRKWLVGRSLRQADAVVTVSEFSRSEILKYFPIDPSKVKVLYHGVEDRFKKSTQQDILAWKQKKGLGRKKNVGFLGSIFNRRNIPVLVEAMQLLREEIPALSLYIVGKDLTHPPQDISRILSEDWIRWETSLKEDDLPHFYSSLDAFAYLSEYEGFGLPPLEALSCGTVPVILAKTALKEVYDGYAVMVEEPEIQQVCQGLREVLQNTERKQALLDRFQKEKSRFSIQRFVEGFSQVLSPLIREND